MLFSFFQRNVINSVLNAAVSGTDDLAVTVELFESVSRPSGYPCYSEQGSIELGRKTKHRINESAVEIDVCGNTLVDVALCCDAMELEEVYAGLLYVYEHADELHLDKDNIVIEGESAGGGLAARLALYNRDKGKVPLKGQVLVYPMLDYRTGGKEDIYNNEYAGEFIWTKENNVFGWGKLIEGQDKKLTDEEMIYFSPAVATVEQLKGLPDTFMIAGSIDLFCNEDMDYARKLMQAGVFTELYVEPGVPHAYEYLEWTSQAARFYELRDHATKRMLGMSI